MEEDYRYKEIVELEGTSIISNKKKKICEKSGVSYFDESHDVDDDMYYTSDDGGKTPSPPPEPLYSGKTPVFDQISELYISGEDEEEPDDINERSNAFVETMEEEDKIQYDTVEEFFKLMIRKFDTSSHSFIWRCLLLWYLFPKNCEFYMEDIIHLWIAQSFNNFPLDEDAACLWYEEFEQMRVVEPSCLDSSTGRLRYKLNHSFVDLLQAQPNIINRYYRDGNAYISERTLHASLQDNFDPVKLQDLYPSKGLVTLLILHKQGSRLDQIPRDLFLKLTLLRALDLSHTCITELPSSIGNLEDLRYLNLSGTPITTLPGSLCSLYQLQTLKLRGCLKFLRLPKGMHKLVNIRHLDVDVSCLMNSMPPGFGNLAELRTLPAFIVSKESGCHITELKNLVNLQGTFRILRLENVSSLKEAKEAALDQKKNLDKLEFHWTELQDGLELLEYLQPHTQVQELQIVGYGGAKFPSWIGNHNFSILTSITIHDCRNCEVLPSLGKLPSLKVLCLSNMIAVKTIDIHFCGRDTVAGVRDFVRFRGKKSAFNTSVAFRTLETLTLKSMLSLEEWSGMKELDFPNLKKLKISDCPKLTALRKISLNNLKKLEISFCPSLTLPNEGLPTSLQHLVITECAILKDRCNKDIGEDWLKIAHIPDIWIDYQHISQSLKGITVPMLLTSYVDNNKDANNDLMFKPRGDPTENPNDDQEKNNRDTKGPSKSKSFLSSLIFNPFKSFTPKGASKYISNEIAFSGSSAGSNLFLIGEPIDELNPNKEILPTSNLRVFSFAELKNATKNFKSDTVLGEGAFGVFKGWIDETYPTKSGSGYVAIKKVNIQGFEEWKAEVNFLGRLSHPNIVRLLGYCWEDYELLLVYEFMEKGSFANHLFRRGSAIQPIPWNLRLKIVLGAARGLAFLHSLEKQIIFRDFKLSNILLDENYNAKLSDFGLATKGPMDGASHVTTTVVGTYGYAAPEYITTGHLNVKSDVFSFGVVLLEMLTGQRVLDTNRPSGQHNLVDFLKPSLSDRRKLMRILDPRLEGEYSSIGVIQAAKLTLNCLGSEPRVRPSMKKVVESLEQIQAIKSKSKARSLHTTHHNMQENINPHPELDSLNANIQLL